VSEKNNALIEAWFSNLNTHMQNRVADQVDDDRMMAHILRWFPLPEREHHRWVYPIRGEVPDDRWTAEDLTAIRALISASPVMKKSRQAVWDDITLCDHFATKPKPKFAVCDIPEAHTYDVCG
jgi:predicted metal-dependent hydrolase